MPSLQIPFCIFERSGNDREMPWQIAQLFNSENRHVLMDDRPYRIEDPIRIEEPGRLELRTAEVPAGQFYETTRK